MDVVRVTNVFKQVVDDQIQNFIRDKRIDVRPVSKEDFLVLQVMASAQLCESLLELRTLGDEFACIAFRHIGTLFYYKDRERILWVGDFRAKDNVANFNSSYINPFTQKHLLFGQAQEQKIAAVLLR
jgi:hypothetical protein